MHVLLNFKTVTVGWGRRLNVTILLWIAQQVTKGVRSMILEVLPPVGYTVYGIPALGLASLSAVRA
eukprot:14782551-Heterocapsa_arctica.AAC.1